MSVVSCYGKGGHVHCTLYYRKKKKPWYMKALSLDGDFVMPVPILQSHHDINDVVMRSVMSI